ncbi:MAG: hypothetical protein R2686_02245 [Candidatus Nanopelagicales bacterium]
MTALALIVLGAVLVVAPDARGRLRGRRWVFPALSIPSRRGAAAGSVVEILAGLRDELEAGAALRPAFERAVRATGDPRVCANAVAVCQMGGDVPAALRDEGAEQPLLVSLAALWQVSEGSGAALASALDRLVGSAEQAAKLRREVAAQLAGPRGTVRVLAVLPAVGVGMGLLMGADPIGFLLGTPWGLGCLAVAIALEAAGIVWMRRLVSTIERQL